MPYVSRPNSEILGGAMMSSLLQDSPMDEELSEELAEDIDELESEPQPGSSRG